MAIYRVHIPDSLDPLKAADRARFVREGFAFWALAFGPFWLLAKRQWLALGMWSLAAALAAMAISAGLFPPHVGGWLYGLGALYLGLEGRNIVSAGLERSGARLVDVATGADRRAAERTFFSRWPALATPGAAATRAAAPPPSQHTIIGLFPEAGG
jgi:Protein of unknown function (DUF2628)